MRWLGGSFVYLFGFVRLTKANVPPNGIGLQVDLHLILRFFFRYGPYCNPSLLFLL
jgi:hypothetical protein